VSYFALGFEHARGGGKIDDVPDFSKTHREWWSDGFKYYRNNHWKWEGGKKSGR
jgi:hypothetical protein